MTGTTTTNLQLSAYFTPEADKGVQRTECQYDARTSTPRYFSQNQQQYYHYHSI
jgi:hypothetical protein